MTVTDSRNDNSSTQQADAATIGHGTSTWTCTIVIPVYNPGDNLVGVVNAVRDSFAARNVAVNVIVVDDGSSEPVTVPNGTNVTVLRHETNIGKGAALRTGMTHAFSGSRNDVIGFVDGDGDIEAEQLVEYGQLLVEERAAGFPTVAVIGSKWADGSRADMSRFRSIQSRTFSYLTRTLMPVGVRDTQAGIKVFNADWLQHALGATRQNGFLLDVELLAIAAAERTSRSIIEQPVSLTTSAGGSTTSARTALAMAWGLLVMSVTTRRGTRLAGR